MEKPDERSEAASSAIKDYYKQTQNRNLPRYFCGDDVPRTETATLPRPPLIGEDHISTSLAGPSKDTGPPLRSLSPTSSVTSNRKLEWDNGADIGYNNLETSVSSLHKSSSLPTLNTLEQEVRAEFFRHSPDGQKVDLTIKAKVTQRDTSSSTSGTQTDSVKQRGRKSSSGTLSSSSSRHSSTSLSVIDPKFISPLAKSSPIVLAIQTDNSVTPASSRGEGKREEDALVRQKMSLRAYKQLRRSCLVTTSPKCVEYVDNLCNASIGIQTELKSNRSSSRSNSNESKIVDCTSFEFFGTAPLSKKDDAAAPAISKDDLLEKFIESNLKRSRAQSDFTTITPTDSISSSNVIQSAATSSSNPSTDSALAPDIEKGVDLLHKLLKSGNYDDLAKRSYIRKIVRKIVESKSSAHVRVDATDTVATNYTSNNSASSLEKRRMLRDLDTKIFSTEIPPEPVVMDQYTARRQIQSKSNVQDRGDFYPRLQRNPLFTLTNSEFRVNNCADYCNAAPQYPGYTDSSLGKSSSSSNWKEDRTLSEQIIECQLRQPVASDFVRNVVVENDDVLNMAKKELTAQLSWINREITYLTKLRHLLEARKEKPTKTTAVYVITKGDEECTRHVKNRDSKDGHRFKLRREGKTHLYNVKEVDPRDPSTTSTSHSPQQSDYSERGRPAKVERKSSTEQHKQVRWDNVNQHDIDDDKEMKSPSKLSRSMSAPTSPARSVPTISSDKRSTQTSPILMSYEMGNLPAELQSAKLISKETYTPNDCPGTSIHRYIFELPVESPVIDDIEVGSVLLGDKTNSGNNASAPTIINPPQVEEEFDQVNLTKCSVEKATQVSLSDSNLFKSNSVESKCIQSGPSLDKLGSDNSKSSRSDRSMSDSDHSASSNRKRSDHSAPSNRKRSDSVGIQTSASLDKVIENLPKTQKSPSSTSSSTKSLSSKSSKSTLVDTPVIMLCRCCHKSEISLTSQTVHHPLCALCFQQNRQRLYSNSDQPYYNVPSHSCNCYTLIKTDQVQAIKETVEDLKELDDIRCINCRNIIPPDLVKCKCKSRKSITQNLPLAYTLRLEQTELDLSNGNTGRSRQLDEVVVKIPVMRRKNKKRDSKSSHKVKQSGQEPNKENKPSTNSKQTQATDDGNPGESLKKTTTLQEYLCNNRPSFVESAEKRRKCLIELAYKREERCLKYKQLLAMTNGIPVMKSHYVKSPEKPRVFSTREMKRITAKNYKNLPEVQLRFLDRRDQDIKKANRLLSDIFNKNLRDNVRKGKLSLSTSTSVINFAG